MDELNKLEYGWEWPETEYVPDGYDMTEIPKFSEANFRHLLKEYTKLVGVVNTLAREHGLIEEK